MHWRRKWQPTPAFLPGESQGRGSLVGCCLWGRTESEMTEATLAAPAAWLYWSSQKVRLDFSLRCYIMEKSKQTFWATQYKMLILGKTG